MMFNRINAAHGTHFSSSHFSLPRRLLMRDERRESESFSGALIADSPVGIVIVRAKMNKLETIRFNKQ
jgi:hypothetical protein